MRTLDEYRAAHPAKPRADTQNLRAIAQEAVRMEALTGDPAFDHFLAYLEAAIQATMRAQNQELMKLRNPLLVNDEEIRKCKITIAQLEARIAALKEVILLPKYLKERGELAKSQIAEM